MQQSISPLWKMLKDSNAKCNALTIASKPLQAT